VSESRLRRLVEHPLPLWIAFVVVHFVLGAIALWSPSLPLGDITIVYRQWVHQGMDTGQWVGVQEPWVYPILALPPMVIAEAFGPAADAGAWLTLVMIVDAAGFALVTGFGRDRRMARLGWFWLAFQLLLGPIALGRIDSITIPVALAGMLLLARAPRAAGVLLAVGAWIKVWPAALVAAAVVAVRRRLDVVAGAAGLSALVVAGVLVLGGGANLLGFVTQQTGRGLQIESGLGTFWMWDAALHGPTSIYYDTGILTFQLRGPGVEAAAAATTPLLAVAVVAVLWLGIVAARRRVAAPELLPAMALAFTTALIVFNKVGSPQFAGWLIVPIVFGLAVRATGRGIPFGVPAGMGLGIAGLTQVVYPYLYDGLLRADLDMVFVLTLRNLLYVALLAWALVRLVALVRRPVRLGEDGEWLPRVWPFERKD
jgi:hypothetical protein